MKEDSLLEDYLLGINFDDIKPTDSKVIILKTVIQPQEIERINILKELITGYEDSISLNRVIDLYNNIKKPAEKLELPRWLIPIIKNEVIIKETDKKTEPNIAKIKGLISGLSSYADNMLDFTTLFKPTEEKQLYHYTISKSRDAIDSNYAKSHYLLSGYKIHGDIMREVREFTDNINVSLNRKAYKKYDNIRLSPDDIISRTNIVAHNLRYNIVDYIKIPFYKEMINSIDVKKLKKQPEKLLSDGIYILQSHDISRLYQNIISELLEKYGHKLHNYYEVVQMYKYHDLNLRLLTGKIFSQFLYKHKNRTPYQPLFFFGDNEDISRDIDIIQETQYSEDQISYFQLKLEHLKKMQFNDKPPEHIYTDDILCNNSLILCNNSVLYIKFNGHVISYEEFITKKTIDILSIILNNNNAKHNNNKKTTYVHKYTNNAFPSYVHKYPTPQFCKIRSIRKYRDIYYLNRLFTISSDDQCILISSGEPLWCKHEIFPIADCSIEINDVIKCKFCNAVFTEKIDTASGFTSLGKPNQLQSGNLYQDLNHVFIIIESVLSSLVKLTDKSKNTIRYIMQDNYKEHEKKSKVLALKTMTNVELYTLFEKTILRYTNKISEVDREFNIMTVNVIPSETILMFYTLDYFYLFCDIISKILICYEIITKIPQNILSIIRKFEKAWNINKLGISLEKKYTFSYFLDRYEFLDKEKYTKMFYKMFLTDKEKILNVSSDYNIYNNNTSLLPEDKTTSTQAYNKIARFNAALANSREFIAGFVLKNIYYDNTLMKYSIKETLMKDYDGIAILNRFIEPSSCILSLLMNGQESILYQNHNILTQDKLDVDYEVNSIYLNNLNELLMPENLIKFNTTIIKPSQSIRHLSKISNIPATYSINIYMPIQKSENNKHIINKKLPSYGITKTKSTAILDLLYFNKNIDTMIEFLNTIKIDLSTDKRKHVRTLGFGDFIVNLPTIKQRKIEMTQAYNKTVDRYLSTPAILPIYSVDISKDVAEILSLVNIIPLKKNTNKIISLNERSDNPFIVNNNYTMSINDTYINFLSLFNYITASAQFTETVETLNQYSKIKKLKQLFNKTRDHVTSSNKNILADITIKNLMSIYKKYKLSKYTQADKISDNFNMYTNIIYRNNLIITLYNYVIKSLGIITDNNFIDISIIYLENKSGIDKIKAVYKDLFEYYYRANKINNSLNNTFDLYQNDMEIKQYKKLLQISDSYTITEDVIFETNTRFINKEADYDEDIINEEIEEDYEENSYEIEINLNSDYDIEEIDIDDINDENMLLYANNDVLMEIIDGIN